MRRPSLFCVAAVLFSVSVSDAAKPFSASKSTTLIPRGGVRQAEKKVGGKADNFVTKEVILSNDVRIQTTDLFPEIMSGMTVALASIPSSIAFANIAGVDPMVGVWSSVILGAVSSFAGMRAGLVCGTL